MELLNFCASRLGVGPSPFDLLIDSRWHEFCLT
jgi:hypothetical protein